MTVLNVDELSISYGLKPLLENVSFRIEKGERVCLIGRNGEGKSTLLKIIAGTVAPTGGSVRLTPGLKLSYLQQEVTVDPEQTVYDEVIGGLGDIANLLRQYHALTRNLDQGEPDLDELERIQTQLEALGGWQISHRIESILHRMGLDPDTQWQALSGGRRRRVCLAKALVADPDLLILDEPTNHLDIESIRWLETLLVNFTGALLFVTHDRQLLRQVATRILELDRGVLTSWPEDYTNYLRRRDERDHAEELANRRFDKKLSQEEVWIRQGIKARRTRNEGRVRALQDLRQQYRERRHQQGQARLSYDAGELSGKRVIEVKGLTYQWPGSNQPIVRDFSFMLQRGERIALLGPNGCGKTTLIKLLLGQLKPTAGEIEHGTKLEIAYFDQMRNQLDESLSILDNVSDGNDFIEINGQRKHIISWLGDFLFSPERLRTPVAALSGGERNRLMLARLFARPANLLVMDEPTNDLDIETLELLEELLVNYSGTLLLVSHDREFIDNTVTSSLVFQGDGLVTEMAGGYTDVQAQLTQINVDPTPAVAKAKRTNPPSDSSKEPANLKTTTKKLTFKERHELKAIPEQIAQLEQQIETLRQQSLEPSFYQGPHEEVNQLLVSLAASEKQIDVLFARWEELDARNE